jgi:hypothetical protein
MQKPIHAVTELQASLAVQILCDETEAVSFYIRCGAIPEKTDEPGVNDLVVA